MHGGIARYICPNVMKIGKDLSFVCLSVWPPGLPLIGP